MILPPVGLGLASIGLCGMTVYNASHSGGGIRMALGATAEQMLWLVMADGFRLVGVGLALG